LHVEGETNVIPSLPHAIVDGSRMGPAQRKSEVLRRRAEFPESLRQAIEDHRDDHPVRFLTYVEDALKQLLHGTSPGTNNTIGGLDCDRDTEEQVETAIRFFPETLQEIYFGRNVICMQVSNRRWRNGCLSFKTVSFVPLLAKLGIELGQFREEERGGLICGTDDLLKVLASNHFKGDLTKANDSEYYRLLDETCLAVLIRLRDMGLFRKEDIVEHNLLGSLLQGSVFPEQRFRFLVDWNPDCLGAPIGFPFFHADLLPIKSLVLSDDLDVAGFQEVLRSGMKYFPEKFGFLFHMGLTKGSLLRNKTAYAIACQKHGKKVVDTILNEEWSVACGRDATNQIGLDALLYASTEPAVNLDLVYTLLRRDPALLLSAKPQTESRDYWVGAPENHKANATKRKSIASHHEKFVALRVGAPNLRANECENGSKTILASRALTLKKRKSFCCNLGNSIQASNE